MFPFAATHAGPHVGLALTRDQDCRAGSPACSSTGYTIAAAGECLRSQVRESHKTILIKYIIKSILAEKGLRRHQNASRTGPINQEVGKRRRRRRSSARRATERGRSRPSSSTDSPTSPPSSSGSPTSTTRTHAAPTRATSSTSSPSAASSTPMSSGSLHARTSSPGGNSSRPPVRVVGRWHPPRSGGSSPR